MKKPIPYISVIRFIAILFLAGTSSIYQRADGVGTKRVGKGTLIRLEAYVDMIPGQKNPVAATRETARYMERKGQALSAVDPALYARIKKRLDEHKAKYLKAKPGVLTVAPEPIDVKALGVENYIKNQVIAPLKGQKLPKDVDAFLPFGFTYSSPEEVWNAHKDDEDLSAVVEKHKQLREKISGTLVAPTLKASRKEIVQVLGEGNLENRIFNEVSFWLLVTMLSPTAAELSDDELLQNAYLMFNRQFNVLKLSQLEEKESAQQERLESVKSELGDLVDESDVQEVIAPFESSFQEISGRMDAVQDMKSFREAAGLEVNADALFINRRDQLLQKVPAARKDRVRKLLNEFRAIHMGLLELAKTKGHVAISENRLDESGFSADRVTRRRRLRPEVAPKKSNIFKYFVGTLLAATLGITSFTLYREVSKIRKEDPDTSWTDALAEAKDRLKDKISLEGIKNSPFALFNKLRGLVTGEREPEEEPKKEEKEIPLPPVIEGEGEVIPLPMDLPPPPTIGDVPPSPATAKTYTAIRRKPLPAVPTTTAE